MRKYVPLYEDMEKEFPSEFTDIEKHIYSIDDVILECYNEGTEKNATKAELSKMRLIQVRNGLDKYFFFGATVDTPSDEIHLDEDKFDDVFDKIHPIVAELVTQLAIYSPGFTQEDTDALMTKTDYEKMEYAPTLMPSVLKRHWPWLDISSIMVWTWWQLGHSDI